MRYITGIIAALGMSLTFAACATGTQRIDGDAQWAGEVTTSDNGWSLHIDSADVQVALSTMTPSPTPLAPTATPTETPMPSSLLTGLVAYWTMDEATGDRVDSVGGVVLTPQGSVGTATGKVSNAVDLTANVQWPTAQTQVRLEAADADVFSLGLSSTGWTVAAWVDQRTVDGWNWASPVVCKGANFVSTGEWCIGTGTWDGSTDWYFTVGLRGPGGQIGYVESSSHLVTNTGYHLVIAWYDPTAQRIYVSTDGGASASVAYAFAPPNRTSKFTIGSFDGYSSASNYGYLDGLVDEVGLWTRILTADERNELWNSGAGKTYPFAPLATPTPMSVLMSGQVAS